MKRISFLLYFIFVFSINCSAIEYIYTKDAITAQQKKIYYDECKTDKYSQTVFELSGIVSSPVTAVFVIPICELITYENNKPFLFAEPRMSYMTNQYSHYVVNSFFIKPIYFILYYSLYPTQYIFDYESFHL